MAILTALRDDQLADFAAIFGRSRARIAHGVEAGTVNTSYAVDLEGRRHFLRIYEEQGMAGATREAALLSHLAANGVRTPPPIAGLDGAFVHELAGKPAALFPWVEGDMRCQRGVTPEAAEKVGGALARIHRVGPPPGLDLGGGRFGPLDLVERCARVARSSDLDAQALADSLAHDVRAVAARRASDLPSGLVHGDLFRDNVLWQGDELVALLDFESAHHGPFAFDLVVLVLSWAFGDTLRSEIARALVRGYESVRALTPIERDGLFDEAIFGTLRFTITRITDDAVRVGKRWQRFVQRRKVIEALGPTGFAEALGLERTLHDVLP